MNILLISTDFHLFTSLEQSLPLNCSILRTETIDKVAHILRQQSFEIIVLDITTTPPQEMDYIDYLKQTYPGITIAVLASTETLDRATRAIQSGAVFYLLKPVQATIIIDALSHFEHNVEEQRQLIENEHQALFDMMGNSPVMDRILRRTIKIAPSSANILLMGENGTGKEFFATIIHKLSQVSGAFVPVNCGAIPETLFESELFGHKKGAFTGADTDRKGVIEAADSGTLFLDEVGELPLNMQVKLLRFLQERTFRRLGESIERCSDCRIIAATNRDLKEMVRIGTFREDLYYRLHVFPIILPPLRDRRENTPNLIRLFVHRQNKKQQKYFSGFTQNAEYILYQHAYPGNIRELENIIEHATIMGTPPLITEADFPEYLIESTRSSTVPYKEIAYTPSEEITLLSEQPNTMSKQTLLAFNETDKSAFSIPDLRSLAELEKVYIHHVLNICNNNHSETAKTLGISRSTLWRRLKDE